MLNESVIVGHNIDSLHEHCNWLEKHETKIINPFNNVSVKTRSFSSLIMSLIV